MGEIADAMEEVSVGLRRGKMDKGVSAEMFANGSIESFQGYGYTVVMVVVEQLE